MKTRNRRKEHQQGLLLGPLICILTKSQGHRPHNEPASSHVQFSSSTFAELRLGKYTVNLPEIFHRPVFSLHLPSSKRTPTASAWLSHCAIVCLKTKNFSSPNNIGTKSGNLQEERKQGPLSGPGIYLLPKIQGHQPNNKSPSGHIQISAVFFVKFSQSCNSRTTRSTPLKLGTHLYFPFMNPLQKARPGPVPCFHTVA